MELFTPGQRIIVECEVRLLSKFDLKLIFCQNYLLGMLSGFICPNDPSFLWGLTDQGLHIDIGNIGYE